MDPGFDTRDKRINALFEDPDTRFHMRNTNGTVGPAGIHNFTTELIAEYTFYTGITGATARNEFTGWLDEIFRGGNPAVVVPTDLESFINSWRDYGAQPGVTIPFYQDRVDPSIVSPYELMLNGISNPTLMSPTSDGDYAVLVGADMFAGLTTPQARRQKLLEDTFRVFIGRYIQNILRETDTANPLDDETVDRFQDAWYVFIGATSTFDDSTHTASFLNRFERTYFAFNPSATQAEYAAELVAYSNTVFAEEGFFLPSVHFEGWLDIMKANFLSAVSGVAVPITFDPQREAEAQILFDIFDLLVEMIGSIQQAASALANRLQFLAQYQQAFSDLMDQMVILHRGDGRELDDGSDDASDDMATANQIGQSAIENLRAFRDIVGDETQQVQTSVNQMNDASSQQGNIATAILQQLSGILTLIFR